jgi:hypothetical protein
MLTNHFTYIDGIHWLIISDWKKSTLLDRSIAVLGLVTRQIEQGKIKNYPLYWVVPVLVKKCHFYVYRILGDV